ncbi:hypothetical protein [Hyalangium gracile]|uniref:hypothetical protein n=1 Tax=Hyalangium gracile TaxID=394092 RepID=UPI001CCB075B|nr:hypothetical protein [Hyalangium gracile]
MERASVPVLHPALLPAGTVVGRWRVVAWGGQGAHGAVYRAVPVGQVRVPRFRGHPRCDGRVFDVGECEEAEEAAA